MKYGQNKLENKEFSGGNRYLVRHCRRQLNAQQWMKNQVKSTESTTLLSACCYPLLLLYTAIIFIHLFICLFIYCRRVFKFHCHQRMRTMKTVVFISLIFALFIASVTSRFVLRGQ